IHRFFSFRLALTLTLARIWAPPSFTPTRYHCSHFCSSLLIASCPIHFSMRGYGFCVVLFFRRFSLINCLRISPKTNGFCGSEAYSSYWRRLVYFGSMVIIAFSVNGYCSRDFACTFPAYLFYGDGSSYSASLRLFMPTCSLW